MAPEKVSTRAGTESQVNISGTRNVASEGKQIELKTELQFAGDKSVVVRTGVLGVGKEVLDTSARFTGSRWPLVVEAYDGDKRTTINPNSSPTGSLWAQEADRIDRATGLLVAAADTTIKAFEQKKISVGQAEAIFDTLTAKVDAEKEHMGLLVQRAVQGRQSGGAFNVDGELPDAVIGAVTRRFMEFAQMCKDFNDLVVSEVYGRSQE